MIKQIPQLEIKFYTEDVTIENKPQIKVEGNLFIGAFKWSMVRYYDHKDYYMYLRRIYQEMSYALISSSFASVPKTEGSETK